MKDLLEIYNYAKKEIKECVLSDLLDSLDEELSEDERRARSGMNMHKRVMIERELLYILIKLNHSDSTFYDEMKSALENVLHTAVSEAYSYDSRDERDAYVRSFFEIFFGDEFDFIFRYLPDNYRDAGRLCDGYLLFNIIYCAEFFEEQKGFDQGSGRIIDSFILFAESCCKQDMLYTLINVLLKVYLIKADPYRAAALYIKHKANVAEYLDEDTANQLFNMANELMINAAGIAKSVFDGLYMHLKLYCRDTSRICWLIKVKIASCEMMSDRNTNNCGLLMSLLKDGIDGKVTDIEDEEEFRLSIMVFCSALFINSIR